jgi:exopolyphosphatase / guanosine-5'-triphosphate,3'-diphosphate pyrophosphatase
MSAELMQLQREDSPQTEVAAIDLGSNSFHMVIAQIKNGQLKVIDRLREPVRLADGLDEWQRLNEVAQQRALACLERFGQRLANFQQGCVRIVGTNTLRTAQNGADFIAKAEQLLGHPIEVVSGTEEARLIYQGVLNSLALDEKKRFVIDIGGGSTELIIGKGFKPNLIESLTMGCVSMSQRYFKGGVISSTAWEKAKLFAHVELEPKVSVYRKLGWDIAVGASGTIRAIDKVIQAAGWEHEGITLSALRRLQRALLEAGNINRLKISGLSQDRVAVFPGGVVILLACFEAMGIKQMRVADGALREGLLYDLLGRISRNDIRSQSVQHLALRYHVDIDQAERVAKTAQRCLKQAARDWNLEYEYYGRWLTWAAMLHEIGLDIAHNQYHKHGAYVIENADLAGFSLQEQKIVALLVLAHRRRFPAKSINELRQPKVKVIQGLAILLRLATLLHRSRDSEESPLFKLKTEKKTLSLTFPKQWLDAHPLTRADLEQEEDYLDELGIKLTFR